MKHKDAVGLSGIFRMNVYKGEGENKKLIETFEDHNLIVNLARVSMAHLLAGEEDRWLKSIAFGTNGIPPTVGDTEITNPYTKDLGAVTYSSFNQAQFSWVLSATEGNGKAIMEFGMLTADGKLFCRRTRLTPINKESDISIDGTWTILF
jgi:hypothetical protein